MVQSPTPSTPGPLTYAEVRQISNYFGAVRDTTKHSSVACAVDVLRGWCEVRPGTQGKSEALWEEENLSYFLPIIHHSLVVLLGDA